MGLIENQLKAIEKDFRKIDRQANKKVLLPAMREAIKPVHLQAKANAPWQSIKRLIKRKSFVSKSGNVIGKVFIGRSKDRTIDLDGRKVPFGVVANILEFGRATKGNKGGSKVVAPVAFMRNAPAQRGDEALNIYEKEVKRNLKKF